MIAIMTVSSGNAEDAVMTLIMTVVSLADGDARDA